MAVESASASVADGKNSADTKPPDAGRPVHGSRIWPYVVPLCSKLFPEMAETDKASSFNCTRARPSAGCNGFASSELTLSPPLGPRLGSIRGGSMIMDQNSAVGGDPIP